MINAKNFTQICGFVKKIILNMSLIIFLLNIIQNFFFIL